MFPPVPEFARVVERYDHASLAVKRRLDDLAKAEEELRTVSVELASWLKPEDAQPGEVFSVWVGSKLYQACGDIITVRAGGVRAEHKLNQKG
jgi:hypothetical protein